MNIVILIGRLTRDPEVKYTADGKGVGHYSLAVDRSVKRDGAQNVDFINCVTFGKNAEFAEKYLRKGTKISVEGRIQTGSYTNRDGQKVYTTDVLVERHEFCESKNASGREQDDTPAGERSGEPSGGDGFMQYDGDDLPFR